MKKEIFKTLLELVFIWGLIIGIFSLGRYCSAADMTKDDYMREAAWQFLNVVDWRQTRVIVSDDRFYEGGGVLSREPARREVDSYFITMSLIHFGGINLLPKAWKEPVQMVMLGVKSGTVFHNYYVGVRFGW